MLHTPEGVRDIYNDDCERKIVLESKLREVSRSYGYKPIQTPTFEYFDIFSREIGTTPSRDLYKFFDREGNTLVLRPDITPSIARCAAKYFLESGMPVRLCYTGNTFINRSSYQGRLKENTQTGAEFIGDASVEADAEILSLCAQMLLASGLKEFQISVGNSAFLRELFAAARLDKETVENIKYLLQNRNFYGVEEVVKEHGIEGNLKELFALLKDVMMTRDKLSAAIKYADDYPGVRNAMQRLIDLEDLLRLYKIEKYVYYELAMVSNLSYYTGIIFAAYTFGSGEAIANGGRYDDLLINFGRPAPSVGFAVIVDQLLSALKSQTINVPVNKDTKWLVYSKNCREDAVRDAIVLRSRGERVELMALTDENTIEFYETQAQARNITDVIYYS